jgi:hypothetical protein
LSFCSLAALELAVVGMPYLVVSTISSSTHDIGSPCSSSFSRSLGCFPSTPHIAHATAHSPAAMSLATAADDDDDEPDYVPENNPNVDAEDALLDEDHVRRTTAKPKKRAADGGRKGAASVDNVFAAMQAADAAELRTRMAVVRGAGFPVAGKEERSSRAAKGGGGGEEGEPQAESFNGGALRHAAGAGEA